MYAQNLIAQFKKIARTRADMRFCLFASEGDSNDARMIEPEERFEVFKTSLLHRDRFWRLGGVSLAAARAHADIIFSPTSNILPSGKLPVVCTIHDVTPIVMPSHSRKIALLLRALLWASARFSRAIITDSQCSKRDLLKTYRLPESKVSVVYLGYDKAIFNDSHPDPGRMNVLCTKLEMARPYILHHGIIQPRKNLKRLIEAYRLLLSRNHNLEFDLVLAGPLGWGYEETLVAAKGTAERRGRVLLAGALESSDLAVLIKGAALVVIPSLYEGFCLPMVEAMACGAPVIASYTSCLPEVSGGVLKYFDPYSVEEMAACMENILETEALRRELGEKGKQRAGYFDWQRCAEETVEILRSQCPQ